MTLRSIPAGRSPETEPAVQPAQEPSQELLSSGRRPDGTFAPGNTAALRHGGYSQQVRDGLLPSQAEAAALLAEQQREIEVDLGGAENLSRVHRDAVRDLLRCELVADHLFDRLLAVGVLTAKGRTRAATTTYLQVLDRIYRLRQMVGLERRAKSLDLARAIQEADRG